MKMRSLKAKAFLFAVTAMVTSTAFAANFDHCGRDNGSSSSSSDVDCNFRPARIRSLTAHALFNLAQVNENLTGLFNMEGTLARNGVNPFTPDTGVLQYLNAINGSGPGSNGAAALDLFRILNILKVNPILIDQILNQLVIVIGLAEAYPFAVNTDAPNQIPLAIAWLASAQQLGGLLQEAGVLSFVINPVTGQQDNIVGLLGTWITLQSQLVQAFRNVLNGPNNVGAIPGDLASQMNAAVILRSQIDSLFNTIGALIVRDLACPGSAGDLGEDNQF